MLLYDKCMHTAWLAGMLTVVVVVLPNLGAFSNLYVATPPRFVGAALLLCFLSIKVQEHTLAVVAGDSHSRGTAICTVGLHTRCAV